MNTDLEEQEDELLALQSIFDSEEFVRDESKSAGEIRVSVELPADFNVVLKEGDSLRQYEISFLPPLLLTFDLPQDYPSSSPPSFTLTCSWLTHPQVRSLVGEELFSRYDRLLLQSTLDHMADVTYCPRNSCGSAVIVDTSSTAAMCSVCNFAFCVKCKKTYHGAQDCHTMKTEKEDIIPQRGYASLPQSKEGLKAVWDDYSSASKERKRILERRYGRDVMQGTLTMWLSDDWITDNCKHCPHCFCKIQKISGCNVMTCTRCHQLFCWACLTRLEKYGSDHFQSSDCVHYPLDFAYRA
uniref:RBR-type E3 ubiquitin transferase n=1 Tax=Amphiprion ocellaris TaxID=80972 RepID=A0AAQ5YH00_AMPOC